MNSLRRRKEEAWQMLGALGWPQGLGDALGGTPGGASISYAEYVATIAPILWLRLRETSGTVAANSGSLGSAQDGTFTPGTGPPVGAVGQAGQLGLNEAYDWNGLDTVINVPATTAINNLAAFSYAVLCKPDTAGEADTGVMITDNGGRLFRINASTFTVRAVASGTVSSANSITATGFINTTAWHYMFMTFDNAGDRKTHIYKGIGGVVTEATYTTNDVMSGTLVNGAGTLRIGANSTGTTTWDGLIDEALVFNRIITAAEMLQLTLLAGLI